MYACMWLQSKPKLADVRGLAAHTLAAGVGPVRLSGTDWEVFEEAVCWVCRVQEIDTRSTFGASGSKAVRDR